MNKSGKLLIVEDNVEILQALQFFLEFEFELITSLTNPNLIPSTLKTDKYDVVLLDMNFSAGTSTGNEGLFWLGEILKIEPQISVIMMTAYGDVDLAVRSIKIGAFDFVMKPWDNDKLLSTLKAGLKLSQSGLHLIKTKNETENEHVDPALSQRFPGFIGECAAIKRIMEIVDKVSETDANILIIGENGTGKGLIAKEIHRKSGRFNHAMVTVDMSTIPLSLFESELLDIKGAFTDARQDRVGRFESANMSTLFLDEIGNLSLNMQTKILNVLQERQIYPLGANTAVPIDVRLICATNKNLERMVMEGLFRQDLLFRINTIQIELPPLRERGHDIELMAGYFLDKFSVKYDKGQMSFDRDAMTALKGYSWPGNIRELEHSIEKAVILSDHRVVTADELFLKQVSYQGENIADAPVSFEEYEKSIIKKALLRNMGNLSNAARELGISRPTIYKKIKQYGL